MNILAEGAIGFVAFIIPAYLISYVAWPRIEVYLRTALALLLATSMELFSFFLLLGSPEGVTWTALWLSAGAFLLLGLLGYGLFGAGGESPIMKAAKDNEYLNYLGRIGLREWLAISSIILFLASLFLIPLLFKLDTNLVWRYRAYLVALTGIIILGMITRKKALTVIIGISILFLVSLGVWWSGGYPVGTPLFHSSFSLTEGFPEEVPFMDIENIEKISGPASKLSLLSDLLILAFSATLVGISGVIISTSILGRGTGRTALVLVLAFFLLIPAFSLVYFYSLGIGSLDFLGNLAHGAMHAGNLLELVDDGELSKSILMDTNRSIGLAGQYFTNSGDLLAGLERLRFFDLLGWIPILGKYSNNMRSLSWGVQEGATGLQLCATGSIDVLDGVLVTLEVGNGTIQYLEIMGPEIAEKDFNVNAVKQGFSRMDSGFVQISSGFPSLKRSFSNLSSLDPSVIKDDFPDIYRGLDELVNRSREMGTVINATEGFLTPNPTNLTPSTHLLYAAFSLSRSYADLTDLREPSKIPTFEDVASNISQVEMALTKPPVPDIRKRGGKVGNSVNFLADILDLIENTIEVTDRTRQVAIDLEEIYTEVQENIIQNLTNLELARLDEKASELGSHSRDLKNQVDLAQNKTDNMLIKVQEEEYGYANELASKGVDLLNHILDLISDLRQLVDLSQAVESLVNAFRSYHDFYNELGRTERRIKSGNLESAADSWSLTKSRMESGRLEIENALDYLDNLPGHVEIPISTADLEDILESSADIEIKVDELGDAISKGKDQEALEIISEMRDNFMDLAQELQMK